MNKGEFIEKLSKEIGTTKTEANKNLDILIKCISESLKDNDELRFVGFGTFKAKNNPEKRVKTPKGVMANVPAQRGVRFSVGSEFKNTINKK
ncbi:MAG: DNA-binding protein HU-beta [Candidatus Midichloriaceae bacterium]|jgi:DNA-binding protein HU-beta